MPRLLLSFFIAFLTCLAGCGLSEQERAVVDANQAIGRVDEAQSSVATVINALPDRPLERSDFSELRSALGDYISSIEQLNAALRRVGGHDETVQEHLNTSFTSAAEGALQSCQGALDALDSSEESQEEYRRALTDIGSCLTRYASAVTDAAEAYRRNSN